MAGAGRGPGEGLVQGSAMACLLQPAAGRGPGEGLGREAWGPGECCGLLATACSRPGMATCTTQPPACYSQQAGRVKDTTTRVDLARLPILPAAGRAWLHAQHSHLLATASSRPGSGYGYMHDTTLLPPMAAPPAPPHASPSPTQPCCHPWQPRQPHPVAPLPHLALTCGSPPSPATQVRPSRRRRHSCSCSAGVLSSGGGPGAVGMKRTPSEPSRERTWLLTKEHLLAAVAGSSLGGVGGRIQW